MCSFPPLTPFSKWREEQAARLEANEKKAKELHVRFRGVAVAVIFVAVEVAPVIVPVDPVFVVVVVNVAAI